MQRPPEDAGAISAATAAPPADDAGGADLPALRLVAVLAGLALLGVSIAGRLLRPDQADFFTLFAMAGLAVAAVPVLIDCIGSLKGEGFEATKYYMDQFVALAVLACFAGGQYVSGGLVAAILIIGQILEERATLGVEEAVRSLSRLSRSRARRLRDGAEEEVEASALRPGDRILLRPGDLVPADGTVARGDSTLDQKLITGESLPVDVAAGSPVFAGTSNLTGTLEVTVSETGDRTVLGRVTQIVEEAKTSRAPVMRIIDRYTRFYLPFVLVVAGFTLFFTRDLDRAVAVIIVATPCAFVLASPSAMVGALAVASRLGILVKSSRFFEVAQDIDTVVFDKTGTLTTGELRVTTLRPAPGWNDDELLRWAAGLERHSTHPVARAIVCEARRRGVEPAHIDGIREHAGRGVAAAGFLAGRRTWLAEQGIALPGDLADSPRNSILCVARDGTFIGSIELADALRTEVREATAQLRALGIDDFVMLTGDRREVAEDIAREAGITRFRAECLPAQKLEEVRALKDSGRRVMVVGDGVNDAPALAAGDLGVAMGALGSEVAIQTADLALMGSDLRQLPRFLRLSDRTLTLINQNLGWGLFFIALFVALSAAGYISPIGAAFLHEFSAFFVILNSARLLRFDADPA